MSANTFGTLFRYTTWGESHGPAIGCVVDGVPPLMPLCEADIQYFLDRRKPGQNRFTTQRQEKDQVEILSGVFDGLTTGTPISLMIRNSDARSKDYQDIRHKYRPGHADFTYDQKYGIRDYFGGGRSSARETASRVAAGAVALKVLQHEIGEDIRIRGAVTQIGPHALNRDHWDWDQVAQNPFFSPDAKIVPVWEKFMDETRKNLSSAGALVEVVAEGLPAGLGAPVSDKLDADIAKALMGINAVKGVEIGAGFGVVSLPGEINADQIRIKDGVPHFLSNHAGGILGGISTGQDIVARMAFKPTSSLPQTLQTIDSDGYETDIATKGRHDPCVGIRGVPVAEAMMAIVLCDHWLRHKAQCL
jgi:chorismate synthase